MLQLVGSVIVYIVDLPEIPSLPVTGNGWERPYADALTEAIVRGIIREPGKYAIEVDIAGGRWRAHQVIESDV